MGRQYQVIAKHSEGATLEPMGTRSQIADDLGTMNIHPQTCLLYTSDAADE